jgi:transcriptional regulator with XRE-family HTH domain
MKRKKQQAQAQTFAERFRQLFEASGMTQGEVARRAGVSPQVVSRLLTAGNADVTLSVACRLAWAMGKSVNEFEEAVFEEWKMQPKTPELIDRELTRGRLRQKLNATRNRIAAWEKDLPPSSHDRVKQVTRRWMEGMMRHWQEQAQNLEERLQQFELGYDPSGSGKLIPKGKSAKKMLTRAEWQVLPALTFRTITDPYKEDGEVYKVKKVGIYHSPEGPMPVAVVEDASGLTEYQLPLQLLPWVETCIGMAMIGRNVFPCLVELGILDGRHYAEMK